MATFTKKTLSGSTDGRGVLVTATATNTQTIHTASSTGTTYQEIWLYAMSLHTADIDLVIEFGGVTDPADAIKLTLPTSIAGSHQGLIPVCEGLVLKGNATPLIVKAYATVASKVSLFGYLNEIAA